MKSLFLGNKIVLNEADEGKGEQLRAGKPRKEEDEEVMTFNPNSDSGGLLAIVGGGWLILPAPSILEHQKSL